MSNWTPDRHTMLAAQARVMAEALLGHPLDDIKPRPYYETLVPKDERSGRNHRRLLVSLLIDRDGENCYLCRQRLQPGHIDIDHIIPISQGGEDEPWNVALACDDCNARKHSAFVSITVSSGHPVYHLV